MDCGHVPPHYKPGILVENLCFTITTSSMLICLSGKVKMALSQFNHPTRLTILRWHLFVWVDLYNGVLGLSTVLKGITTLPQHGLETLNY